MKSKDVVWFDEVGKDDIPLVGGKGANLGEMTRAKIPVPPGFAVTAQTYFSFLDSTGLRERITKLLEGLDVNDNQRLQQAATDIKRAIIDARMPQDVARQIRQAYRKLGGGPVAVRSSATAEDLPEASFAGQQSTYLNVVGEENVVAAVKACWASLFEARAIYYRVQGNFDHMQVGIAVPVQRMVQSERSGVMFTVEPVSSDESKIVVEAICGLGEAIVSGQVTPDLYVVDKGTLEIVDKHVAIQDQQLVRGLDREREALGSNVWEPVPPFWRNRQKLPDGEIQALAEIGLKVEKHYGRPQDIEWAKENGRIYLVQTRPVTTLAKGPAGKGEAGEAETAPVLLSGSPASPGVASGPVRIALDPSNLGVVKDGDVLVAEMTTPDFVPAMKRAVAIVTDRGGRTAHAAIVSRELGIPCVVGSGDASTLLKDGQIVTVDGSLGVVYEGRAEISLKRGREEMERQSEAADLPTRTNIYVNLAEPDLADKVAQRNVDGVGLLRAEFIIAEIGEHPRHTIEEGRAEEFIGKLAEGLRKFAAAFGHRPVIYRASDFKTNEYANLRGGEKYEPHEENPMIGYRGASRYIDEPEVFMLEIEAIKRVRKHHKNLWLMIPFVRTPQELARVKEILAENGLVQSADFKLWMMAEVPSNVFLLNEFIDVGIDGISIGSNDLTQLILGIDRDNAHFAKEFDERNEAVMRALETLITTARDRGITCSICGQAPSDYPELTAKLVQWGITSVSVNPDVIDRTREIVYAAEQKLAAPVA